MTLKINPESMPAIFLFDAQQTALEIYKKTRADSRSGAFRVDELAKCLKALCSSRLQALEKEPIDGLLRYWKRVTPR